jgi:signal recognition particle GTPase
VRHVPYGVAVARRVLPVHGMTTHDNEAEAMLGLARRLRAATGAPSDTAELLKMIAAYRKARRETSETE